MDCDAGALRSDFRVRGGGGSKTETERVWEGEFKGGGRGREGEGVEETRKGSISGLGADERDATKLCRPEKGGASAEGHTQGGGRKTRRDAQRSERV